MANKTSGSIDLNSFFALYLNHRNKGYRHLAKAYGCSIKCARYWKSKIDSAIPDLDLCKQSDLDALQSGRKPSKVAKFLIGATLEEDMESARLKAKQNDAEQSISRYASLLKRAAHEEEIISQFKTGLLDALQEKTFSISIPAQAKRANTKQTSESAVLTISDSHVWKIVEKNTTFGLGNYNPKIFLDRLSHLESSVIRLITQNIDNPIRKLYVLFLGDLVEGMLNHGAELPQRGYIVDQVQLATWAFYQFIARISRVVDVSIRGLGGNHSRWPNQKRVPTEGTFSNFDFIVLGQIEAMLEVSKLDRVEFTLEESPFQVFDIEGWRFKIGHGDHLKGGDKAMGVPAHSIGREINSTTQRYNAIGQKAPDYYLVGDKHRHMSLATATGRYMVNGAFFENDNYALRENFMPNRPHQMFFGVHPKHGKSWSYDLTLDKAPAVPINYDFPKRLREKLDQFES